jgi:hypothetical protein
MMLIFALAAATSAPHYDLHARFDPQGQLDAQVFITLPEDMRDKSFILSRRFTLNSLELPPGVILTAAEPSDTPVAGLYRYRFQALPGHQGPIRLAFRYTGPINYPNDNGVTAFRPEGYELFIDHMWFPVGADIQTRFTLDARFEGLSPDLVPVGQGEVTRTPTGVRIRRDFIDIDVPLVAMRGLERAEAEGVEFYAPDLGSPRATFYARHSEEAARFFGHWFGPLHHVVRMALVRRERTMAYARTAYTVFPERPGETPPTEVAAARHAAHEVAHAWWMLASPLTDDFWLVESTAEYCAIRYIEARMGVEEAERFLAEKRRASADAGPVMGHGRPSRVQLYQKGPLLLVELERRIGRPAMDRLMAEVAREPAHTTQVFLGHLTRIAGEDAADAFAEALRS